MSTLTSTLNGLIETLNDGHLGYTTAANDAQRPELKTLLQKLGAERADFAAQLQQIVQQLGETPEKTGTVAGDLHRGWINLKAAISTREDLAILEECQRGDESAVSAFQSALSEDLGSARGLVEHQLQHLQTALGRIASLHETLKSVHA